jgi:hypothetical protein
LQCYCQKAGGDLFAGCHDSVVFAGVMHRGCVAAPFDQFIGLAGHGRDHHGNVMAGIDLALDVQRDVADAVDIGDRRAAEFHDEPTHANGAFPDDNE